MLTETVKKIVKFAIVAGLALILVPRLITALYSLSHSFTAQDVPPAPVAIVFGAGLWRDGTPTPVLRDRIITAADLYFRGKVQKLLMSGDNSHADYNEPAAMRQYAIGLGVPENEIVVDYAGRRTYDTCYRAKAIFGIQQAILVTQKFHLARALYTCHALGIAAVGVAAENQEYRTSSLAWWNIRELPATLTALLQVHIVHPLPILGKPEPIFPAGSQ